MSWPRWKASTGCKRASGHGAGHGGGDRDHLPPLALSAAPARSGPPSDGDLAPGRGGGVGGHPGEWRDAGAAAKPGRPTGERRSRRPGHPGGGMSTGSGWATARSSRRWRRERAEGWGDGACREARRRPGRERDRPLPALPGRAHQQGRPRGAAQAHGLRAHLDGPGARLRRASPAAGGDGGVHADPHRAAEGPRSSPQAGRLRVKGGTVCRRRRNASHSARRPRGRR